MKKVLSLLLSIVLVFSLAACSSDKNNSDDNKSETSKTDTNNETTAPTVAPTEPPVTMTDEEILKAADELIKSVMGDKLAEYKNLSDERSAFYEMSHTHPYNLPIQFKINGVDITANSTPNDLLNIGYTSDDINKSIEANSLRTEIILTNEENSSVLTVTVQNDTSSPLPAKDCTIKEIDVDNNCPDFEYLNLKKGDSMKTVVDSIGLPKSFYLNITTLSNHFLSGKLEFSVKFYSNNVRNKTTIVEFLFEYHPEDNTTELCAIKHYIR